LFKAVKYKNVLALLVAFLLPFGTEASSVVLIITRHGIVIGADGKTFFTDSSGKLTPPLRKTVKKIALIGNSVVITQTGLDGINTQQGFIYTFDSVVDYLQASNPPIVTVE